MKLTFLRDLFRPIPRPARQFDLNDPQHPVNVGWRRVDLPEGRRVRFRVTVPDIPKTTLPGPDVTHREYMAGLR